MAEPVYRRVVIKLSGEYLAGSHSFGIDQPTIDRIADDLIAAQKLGVEVAVGIVCLARKRTYIQAGLLAWLGTNFAAYRIGLLLIGYHTCPCLGSLTDALRLSRHMADTILKIVLAYLLIGSYVVLCCLWLQRRKDARVADGRE